MAETANDTSRIRYRDISGITAIDNVGQIVSFPYSGCITYWKMDEDTGTSVADSTGNSNTGTFNGTWGTGLINACLSLDGSNDYMYSTTQYTNPQTFSISIWFKTSTASGHKIIGFENTQTGTGSTLNDRHLYINTSGNLVWGVYEGGFKYLTSSGTYNDGAWHHVVINSDGGDNQYMYIDGTYEGTIAYTGYTFNGYWRIGSYKLAGWAGASDGYFTGLIDEVGIWNRELTTDEITKLYNGGNGITY